MLKKLFLILALVLISSVAYTTTYEVTIYEFGWDLQTGECNELEPVQGTIVVDYGNDAVVENAYLYIDHFYWGEDYWFTYHFLTNDD